VVAAAVDLGATFVYYLRSYVLSEQSDSDVS